MIIYVGPPVFMVREANDLLKFHNEFPSGDDSITSLLADLIRVSTDRTWLLDEEGSNPRASSTLRALARFVIDPLANRVKESTQNEEETHNLLITPLRILKNSACYSGSNRAILGSIPELFQQVSCLCEQNLERSLSLLPTATTEQTRCRQIVTECCAFYRNTLHSGRANGNSERAISLGAGSLLIRVIETFTTESGEMKENVEKSWREAVFRSAGALISVCELSDDVVKKVVGSDTLFKLLFNLLGKKMKLTNKRQQAPVHTGFLKLLVGVQRRLVAEGEEGEREFLEMVSNILERDRRWKEKRRVDVARQQQK